MQLVYARMLLCGTDGDFENVKLQSHKSTINLTVRHQTTCVDVDVCFTPVVELGLSDHSSMRDLLNDSLSSASWDLRRTIKHLIQRAREAGMVQRHGEPRGTELKSVVIAALCCAYTTLICSSEHSFIRGLLDFLNTLEKKVLVLQPHGFVSGEKFVPDTRLSVRNGFGFQWNDCQCVHSACKVGVVELKDFLSRQLSPQLWLGEYGAPTDRPLTPPMPRRMPAAMGDESQSSTTTAIATYTNAIAPSPPPPPCMSTWKAAAMAFPSPERPSCIPTDDVIRALGKKGKIEFLHPTEPSQKWCHALVCYKCPKVAFIPGAPTWWFHSWRSHNEAVGHRLELEGHIL